MRRLLAGLALVLAVSLAVGVGSYTSASRGVDVAVVPDDEAYLGVVPEGFDRCGRLAFVTLYNRFGENVTLDVDVRVVDTDGGLRAAIVEAPASLGGGESGVVKGHLTPTDGAAGDELLALAIDADGEGVSVSLRRTYAVACAKADPSESARGRGTPGPPGDLSERSADLVRGDGTG
ncbi:hypothetical protein [Salinirarus marinus]|uniref:hypothetical protein n=1 Tax=Salinirarus marinus TaxID=3068310 RepID=UPI003C6C9C3A